MYVSQMILLSAMLCFSAVVPPSQENPMDHTLSDEVI